MTEMSKLQQAAGELRKEALACADKLDQRIATHTQLRVGVSGLGMLGSVTAAIAASVMTGGVAVLTTGGVILGMGAAAGYRGSLAWQASTERAELQKISQKLDVLKRESRSVLHASGISTEELEASINKQANVTEDELTWCAIVFAFHIIPLVAPIGTYVVKDAWVSARKVNPLPFVQGCYKLLESFNWRKLLELIRSRQLDMVSFALLLTAANTVNFFRALSDLFAEKKSDVGKLLRDIAAFLEDIEKREIFIENNVLNA